MSDDSIKIGVFIDLGICGRCRHLMAEEVDYDYYQTEDGHCMAIPEGCEPPAFICCREADKGKLNHALGISYHDEATGDVALTSCDYFQEAEQ